MTRLRIDHVDDSDPIDPGDIWQSPTGIRWRVLDEPRLVPGHDPERWSYPVERLDPEEPTPDGARVCPYAPWPR